MIKDLMDKMQLQDSINSDTSEETKKQVERDQKEELETKVPKPPSPPKPPMANIKKQKSEEENYHDEPSVGLKNSKKEVVQMEDGDGIIIDLGDGLSLNVPIKRRMSLQEFLRVAEKVKALEMLSEENQRY